MAFASASFKVDSRRFGLHTLVCRSVRVDEVLSFPIDRAGQRWRRSRLGRDGSGDQVVLVGGRQAEGGSVVVSVADSLPQQGKLLDTRGDELPWVLVDERVGLRRAVATAGVLLQLAVATEAAGCPWKLDCLGFAEGEKVALIGAQNAVAKVAALWLTQIGRAKLTIVAKSGRDLAQKVGADHFDPEKEPFASSIPGLRWVFDSLGSEEPSTLRKLDEVGIRYTSVASPDLMEALEGGLFSGALGLFKRFRSAEQGERKLWNAQAGPVQSVMELMFSHMPPSMYGILPDKLSDVRDAIEAGGFPRNAETGGRFGFPSEENSFDWGETLEDRSNLDVANPTETEDLPDRSFKEILDDISPDTAAVNIVESIAEIADIIRDPQQELTLLYVHGSWCRRCKFISPKLAKVASELRLDPDVTGRIQILSLDSELSTDAVETLGVTSVPAFLVYRRGVRIPSYRLDKASTSSKSSLKAAILSFLD